MYSCKYCDKSFESIKQFSGHCRAHQDKPSQRTVVIRGKHGGYRPGVGKGVKGFVRGTFCDSTWEAFVFLYYLDHGYEILRCTKTFDYKISGVPHVYHPDFQIGNTVIEVKGYIRPADKFKWRAVRKAGYDLIVIDQQVFNSTIYPFIADRYSDRIKHRRDLSPIFDSVSSVRVERVNKHEVKVAAIADTLGISSKDARRLYLACNRSGLSVAQYCDKMRRALQWLASHETINSRSSVADAGLFAKSIDWQTYQPLQCLSRQAFDMSLAKLLQSRPRSRKIKSDFAWNGLTARQITRAAKSRI